MAKIDRSILQANDQNMGQFGDPDKLESSISHLADKIDENDNGFNAHKTATELAHPDNSVTERKLASSSVSRRVIQPGAVGTDELDPAILSQPTTVTGVQAKLQQQDELMEANARKADDEIRNAQSNPKNYTGAIVTIIDDDARPEFRTVWQPILEANPGVKIGIAVVKDWTLDGSALSLSELITLQDDGHDILCHTTHHVASYEITPEAADEDYPEAVQWMKDNGLNGYEHLVYPGGLSPNAVNIKDIARKHFKYAVSTEVAGDYAITPVDNWCIPRINGDAKSLAQLKAAVDYAKANGIWLVLMTHSHVLLQAGSQKMSDFINYVINQGVPIMPYSEAIKYKGNAVAVGEYTTDKKLFIGVDGNGKGLSKKGTWTPKLIGTTTAGTHTYAAQGGNWIKVDDLIIATFDINISAAGLDAAMAGNLQITGLPFPARTISRALVEYNILNLGTNYTAVFAGVNAPDDKIALFKTGNGVNTAYVGKGDIPAGQTVIFRGQVTYQTEV